MKRQYSHPFSFLLWKGSEIGMALHFLPVALDLENSRGLVLKFRGKYLPLEFYACTCVKYQDEIKKKPLTGKLSNKMKKKKRNEKPKHSGKGESHRREGKGIPKAVTKGLFRGLGLPKE